MIATLKAIVVPKLQELGFSARYPHFHRVRGKRIDLLSFQFNRYGGSFVVEVASCPKVGKMSWGDPIDPECVNAQEINERLRLGSKPPEKEDHWFTFDSERMKTPRYSKAAEEVLSCLPQAERYWRRRR